MRAYLLVMFAIPLRDILDTVYERFANRYSRYGPKPFRWFDFGYLESDREQPMKFWHLRLPSYDWTQFDYGHHWGWGQRTIWWAQGRGLHVDLWECDR